MAVWLGLGGTLLGLFLLIWGSNLLIDGSAGLAKKKGISGHVIGLTLVATATSLPELATAITATLVGNHGIAIGNVVGSNAFNVGFVLAIGALIVPILPDRSATRDGLIVLVATGLFAIFAVLTGKGIGRIEALVLFLLYGFYVIYLIRTTKISGQVEVGDKTSFALLGMILIGTLFLFIGSPILVNSAVRLSRVWGVEDSVIAVTLIAAGTSLPELIAGVTAAVKGHEGIAVGNVLGSNLFNILLIPGIAALIHPLDISPLLGQALIPGMLLITAIAVLLTTRKLGKKEGVLLLVGFTLFFILSLRDVIPM